MSSGSIYLHKLEPIGSTGFSSPAAPRFGWRRLFVGLALLVLSGIFTPAQAQYANGYSYRVEVDFVDAEVSGGPHTNFPVLISSTVLDLRTVGNGGEVENANGYDIIFTSDQAGNTQLAHEIENYVAVTGEIYFWVRVESLAATTKIYMFYSNSSISTFQGNVTSNGVTGVWDDDYEAVWHLEEQGGATHDDSTGVHDGTRINNVYYAGEGRHAQTLDGDGDYISTPDHDGYSFLGGDGDGGTDGVLTVSAWVKGDTDDFDVVSKHTWPGPGEWDLWSHNGKISFMFYDGDVDYMGRIATTAITAGWHHVAGTYDGSNSDNGIKLFIDGVEQASTEDNAGNYDGMSNQAVKVQIGTYQEGGNRYDYEGEMDEARVSGTVRAPQWIETGFNNQLSPPAFYTLGSEEVDCSPATLPYTDNFNRPDRGTVGNCWAEELESGSADAIINSNRLQLNSSDDLQAPRISRTFTQVTSGQMRWTYTFNWDRTGSEAGYALWMQLGNSATMVDPAISDNTGVAVNLKWAGTSDGMTNHEGFGYVQGLSTTQVAVVSGGVGNDHTIEVIADLDLNTFTLKIDDVTQASGVAFDSNVNIDAVRIYSDGLNVLNFGNREFDDLMIDLFPGIGISGRVFEDANFTGTASTWDGGTNDLALANVDVELYTSGDVYQASTTTDVNGNYVFGGVPDGDYKVRVRAATIGDADTPPQGGLEASVPATWPYPLAEMTWGDGGAVYGGQSATADDTDTADNAGPGDTYVSVSVSGVAQTDVDFGFAYNLIVNVEDDTQADNAQSQQGSLRQFIKNANAIGTAGGTTANDSEFRMQVATNQSSGGDAWWRITTAADLPILTFAGTTLDASTQRTNSGTNSNTLGPEIEVDGAATYRNLQISGGSCTVREIASNNSLENGIYIFTGDSNTIEGNYLGIGADGTTDRGNTTNGIQVDTDSNTLGGTTDAQRNVISGNTSYGIFFENAASSNTVRGNYVGTNASATGTVGNGSSGIRVESSSNNNIIGGTAAGAGNVIGGNARGVHTANTGTTGTIIQGNYIGTNSSGTLDLGNGSHGVSLNNNSTNSTVGGSAAGAGNVIAFNGQDGVFIVNLGTDGHVISANSIYSNGGLGIDIAPDGVGTGSGANEDKVRPTITSVVASGSDFTVTATVTSGDVIEFFRVNNAAAPVVAVDGSGAGEGFLYLGSCIDNGACSGPHIQAGSDGDGAGGTIVVTVLASGIGGGDHITATATDASNNTSEFSDNVGPLPDYDITGRVFEDANFTGTASIWDGGTNDLGLENVDVELYTSADVYQSSTTTDSNGNYIFDGVLDGDYKVRVRAATIGDADTPPQGGLEASVPATWPYPLAEMTWGNGVALYGGQSATVDDGDTADDAGPGDTYVSISLSGADLSGVDFGFAYNLIVNVEDDTQADNAQSQQGSLRQFIKNANAIGTTGGTTANDSEFRMQVATNQSSGGDAWWRITTVADLPILTFAGTTLDASTQRTNSGSDSNTLGPEIEIDGAAQTYKNIQITGGSSVVRELAVNNGFEYGIYLLTNGSNTIEGCYIGISADGTTDRGNLWHGIYNNSSNTIGGTTAAQRNVISGNDRYGVRLANSSSGTTVQGNYIGTNASATAAVANTFSGINLGATTGNTIGGTAAGAGNIISGNTLAGILAGSSGSTDNTVQGNTIGTNSTGTADLGNGTHGILIAGSASGNTIGGTAAGAANVIAYNTADGIYVDGADTDDNLISANSIYLNGGLGIDIAPDGVGTGSGANEDKVRPTITSVVASGSDFTVTATVTSGDVIEFFRVNNAAVPVVTADGSGAGEGFIYLGSAIDNGATSGPHIQAGSDGDGAGGTIVVTLLASGMNGGDNVTATATDASNNTSEFSDNVAPAAVVDISGRVFEDANFTGTASTWDGGTNDLALENVDVELYTIADVYQSSTTTDVNGNYSFAGVPDGDYKVRARAATIGDADTPPQGGLEASVPATWPYPLAEMTWGDGGQVYGGQSATADDTDTADNAGPGDTYVAIRLNGVLTDVDFGFAYNLIVNVEDDTELDSAKSQQGSLRQFMKNANAIGTTGGTTANDSEFRMQVATNQSSGGDAWWRITTARDLPILTFAGTTLDASTQRTNSGSDSNTLGPEIEIDGAAQTYRNLQISGGSCVVREFAINNGLNEGIHLLTSDSNTIEGNYLGIGADGTTDRGNGTYGVNITASSTSNTIGGTAAGAANTIAYNTDAGIHLDGAATDDNLISANSIYLNGGLGIDIAPDGVGTGSGANNDKARPTISSVAVAGADFTVTVTVTSGDVIEFFRVNNAAAPVVTADGAGAGEGFTYLGSVIDNGATSGPHIQAGSDGDGAGGTIVVTVLASGIAGGDDITATARDASNNTSEFSDNVAVPAATVGPLLKRAFLADGTPLSNGDTLTQGTVVKFLIYFNNMGVVQSDVSVRDVLDPLFAHQAATLKINNTTAACALDICTALEEATIFTDVNAAAVKTDAVDGDEVSITGSTVDAGNENVANAAMNAAENKVWALLVQVTIQ